MRAARLMLLALVVLACGGSPASTKYTQTWTKSYGSTTCADWNTAMDDHQKFVMAGDMLLSAQKKDKPDATVPADSTINNFAADIGADCADTTGALSADQKDIPTIAAVVYLSSSAYKP